LLKKATLQAELLWLCI